MLLLSRGVLWFLHGDGGGLFPTMVWVLLAQYMVLAVVWRLVMAVWAFLCGVLTVLFWLAGFCSWFGGVLGMRFWRNW